MPLYEYQCNKCGKIEEALVLDMSKNHDNFQCPYCQPGKMKKIISAHSVIDRANLRIPAAGSRQRRKIKW